MAQKVETTSERTGRPTGTQGLSPLKIDKQS